MGRPLHRLSRSKMYFRWRTMIRRCANPKDPSYRRYGGRGISVCDKWRNDFLAFAADMGVPPTPKHSLDRINNDGNYEPGNVRWATSKEQRQNTTRNRIITYQGRSMPRSMWAEELGISSELLYLRLKRGWPLSRALKSELEKSGPKTSQEAGRHHEHF